MTDLTTNKKMTPTKKVNAIEIGIFVAVAGIFANSIHQLINESGQFHAKGFAPLHSNLMKPSRNLASVGNDKTANPRIIDMIEINCDEMPGVSTKQSQVRVEGEICKAPVVAVEQNRGTASADPWLDMPKIESLKIKNTVNLFEATVLADPASKRFKTDLMPLAQGMNTFKLEFKYKSGKVFVKDFSILKD